MKRGELILLITLFGFPLPIIAESEEKVIVESINSLKKESERIKSIISWGKLIARDQKVKESERLWNMEFIWVNNNNFRLTLTGEEGYPLYGILRQKDTVFVYDSRLAFSRDNPFYPDNPLVEHADSNIFGLDISASYLYLIFALPTALTNIKIDSICASDVMAIDIIYSDTIKIFFNKEKKEISKLEINDIKAMYPSWVRRNGILRPEKIKLFTETSVMEIHVEQEKFNPIVKEDRFVFYRPPPFQPKTPPKE